MGRSAAEPVRVGWFGGTFDPPHHGHLRLAIEARQALALDRVDFVPAARNPLKPEPPSASAADRLAMLTAAIDGEPGLAIDASDLDAPPPSFTVDALRRRLAARPDERIVLLLGADAWASFGRWRDPQGILAVADVAIAARPKEVICPPVALPDLDPMGVLCYDGDHDEKRWVVGSAPGVEPSWRSRIVCFPTRPLSIASSAIRADLRAGRRVRYLLPDAVLRIIEDRRLYA